MGADPQLGLERPASPVGGGVGWGSVQRGKEFSVQLSSVEPGRVLCTEPRGEVSPSPVSPLSFPRAGFPGPATIPRTEPGEEPRVPDLQGSQEREIPRGAPTGCQDSR
ncbi:unnamed protein product [Lepidochelys kempii]